MRTPAIAALFANLAASAYAAPTAAISVSDAWSRPVAAGLSTGVAYLTLRNSGSAADRLMAASTPVAARVSLHRSMDMGGVMSMSPVADGLPVAANGEIALAPGGYHLMLEGLKQGLTAGSRYPLTLRFAHGRPVTVEVAVRPTPPASP